MNPVWSEERFVFSSPFFPVYCICYSSNKAVQERRKGAKRKEKEKDKKLSGSGKDEVMGQFLIQVEDIPKQDQAIQNWYTLQPGKDSILRPQEKNPNKARIFLELVLS